VAFSKFDPHRPEVPVERTSGDRRAALLNWGWKITLLNTLFGFVMIGYFFLR
jgi:hypothetical protein